MKLFNTTYELFFLLSSADKNINKDEIYSFWRQLLFSNLLLLFTNCFYLNVVSLKTINHTTIGHYCIGRKLVYETFQYILWAVFLLSSADKNITRMKFVRYQDNWSFQTCYLLHHNCFYINVVLLKTINETTIGHILM